MRKINEVIDEVLAVIPEGNQLLKTDLEKIKRDAGYKAPEGMRDIWIELVNVLNHYLPYPPVEPWHKQISDIMTGGEK